MSLVQWLILAVAALLVGVTKTSIGGLGVIVVALFAFVFPAKESTASSTFLLISGDILAVSLYHKQADWHLIRSLLPAVIPGIALGALFMHLVDDKVMLIGIGSCIAVTLIVQLILRIHATIAKTTDDDATDTEHAGAKRAALTIGTGVAAGFVTIVGNAAAAVMSLYLLVTHTNKMRFVASAAWFYCIVNLCKVPFLISLRVLNWHHVIILVTLVPLVLISGLLGRRFLTRINQGQFEGITLVTTIVACVILLVRGILA
ncbi:MAG: sulfite exporter TauE/SafE family protein [Propionibacteriaceae bacterium]|nr:sulfite exporter TauE/SafE family protein [Propionibacteriaceae bacterium]